MGLYDYFEPNPPLECPKCGGWLLEWQGSDGHPALLVWRQGVASPLGQRVDVEYRSSAEELARCRVPSEFSIYGGECDCGYGFDDSRFSVHCKAADGVWQTAEIVPAPTPALDVGDGWVRCSECCDVWVQVPNRAFYLCPGCSRLTRLVSRPA